MSDSRSRVLFQKLVTISGDEYENGELVIEQGRVVEVRPDVSASFAGVTHDLSDALVLPGFVNAHCHLSLSGLAGNISRQQRFVDWIESVVLQNKALSWQARIEAMHREAKTLIASGVTTIGDYFSHPELLAEYQTLPFRQELFLETLGFQREVAESRAGEVAALLEEHPGHGNQIRLAVAPHAPYSVSPELFRRLKQLADQWHCRLSCHLAEVREEFQFLRTGRGDFLELLKSREVYDDQWSPPGVGPVTYLDQLGVLEGMTCIHLNHIDRRDLERLAQSHASAVFCPGSTRWFGRDKWLPVRELLDRGISVGLGSDSLASNESLDFLREIRLAEEMLPELHRTEILWMSTVGGSQALGLDHSGLEPGQPADLIGFRGFKAGDSWWDPPFDPERKKVDFSMISGKSAADYSDTR